MIAPTLRSRAAQPSRRRPIPGAKELSTVEWQSAQVMPTLRSCWPEGSKNPRTPTTAFSLRSASVVAGSSRSTRSRRNASFRAAGKASTSTLSPSASADFGLSPGPVPPFARPAIDWCRRSASPQKAWLPKLSCRKIRRPRSISWSALSDCAWSRVEAASGGAPSAARTVSAARLPKRIAMVRFFILRKTNRERARFPRVSGRLQQCEPLENPRNDAIAAIAEELEAAVRLAGERRAELGLQQQAGAMRPSLHRGDRNAEIPRGLPEGHALDFPQHEHRAEGQWQGHDRAFEDVECFRALDAKFRIPERALRRNAFDGRRRLRIGDRQFRLEHERRPAGAARPQAVDGLVRHDAREPGAKPRPAGKARAFLESPEVAVLEHVLRVGRVTDQAQREPVQALVVLAHDRFERIRVGGYRSGSRPFSRNFRRLPCADRSFHCRGA